MKFDFVIGNPPYQEGGPRKKIADLPVYCHFMDAAFEIASRVELITPARFLFNVGKTPKSWNEKTWNDPHFTVLKCELKSDAVFPGTDIKGGVAISYRDKFKKFKKTEIFVYHPELLSLVNKVAKTNFAPLSELISARSSYRFTDKMYLEHPEIKNNLLSGNVIASNVFNKLENIVFFKERPADNEEYVQIYGRKNNERKYMWIKRKYIEGIKNFEKYKVMFPVHNGSGAIGEVLSTPLIGKPLIGKPLIGQTESFLTMGCFEREDEALNCLKYIKTKFARAMLGVLKTTQSNSREKWRYVPQQNFSVNSDIDWKKSINEIDLQLYRKYNLTDEEIEFIESNVRVMHD